MSRKTIAVIMLALGVLAAPLAADAQQAGKIYRVGFLAGRAPIPSAEEAFQRGLSELGWVENQNIAIEYRWAEGKLDRLPNMAAELVRLKVDVIVAVATPAILAAKQATTTTPIVMFGVGNPVEIWDRCQPRTAGRKHYGSVSYGRPGDTRQASRVA